MVDAITELTELRDRLAEQIRVRVHAALGPDADLAVAALFQGQYIKALATAGAAHAAGIPGAPAKEARGLHAQHR